MKKPLHAIYKDGFFRKRHLLHWRAPIFCEAVIKEFAPSSVLDVGCATGDLVRQFRQMNVFSDGIEGSPHAIKHAVIPDLHVLDVREDQTIKRPYQFYEYSTQKGEVLEGVEMQLNGRTYDLVCCLEVAEHIEPEYTKTFLKNLAHWSDKILLSIAGPGQKGLYHVNLQEMPYWDDLMARLDYRRNQFRADQVKYKIRSWKDKPGIKAFWANLVYYERM